tara:strand:+ start:11367 stop:12503 length:1137 start_codon:yes stop_codon:yes gene_type:complete
MAKAIFMAAVGASLLASAAAQAQQVEQRPYFSLGGQYLFDDDERFSDAGYGGYFGIGKRFWTHLGFELYGFANTFDRDVAEWDEAGGGVDAHVYLNQSSIFAPYLLAGGGYINSKEQTLGFEFEEAYGNVGAGANWFPNANGYNFGIRGEYKYRFFEASGVPGIEGLNDHILSLGLILPFGAAPAKAEVVASTPVVDSDGDGVPDDRDLCPGTPAGSAVDSRGCPSDSDGDGVPDYLDKCPNTAVGVTVDKDGCPVETDSPARTFENVNFEFDRSDLTEYARGILDSASQVINSLTSSHSNLVVQIDGHTDAIGSPGYNMALSERRANSVKQYLVRKGVDANRIRTQAYGLTKPIATNDTDAGRALNRRAEVRTRVGQ